MALLSQKDAENVRRAAIVLVLMGDEVSSEIMKFLTQDEAKELSKAIFLLGSIPPKEAESVLTDFHQLAIAQEYVAQGGLDFARKILSRAYGSDGARRLLDQVTRSLGPINLDILSKADPQQLAKFIEQEHPQTVALVLAHLPSSMAAQMLGLFNPDLRADIAMRMANIEQISQDIISKITAILTQKLEAVGDFSRESYGGIQAVAELFNRMDWMTGKAILEKVEEKDPNLAVSIRNLMFVFDDIMTVDEQVIREILKELDRKVLGMAMKGTSEQLKQRFFKNMSERAAELLKEDMEYMGAVKLKDVEQAQQDIVNIIRRLEEQGVISLKGGGEQYVV
jgi:flagellar motor switch protein FliG